MRPGLGQGRDDEDLVDVGGEDLLAIAIAAGDHAAAGLDLLDQPLVAGGPAGPEPDAVADRDDVPALDRQGLEQAADVAGIGPPVVGPDHQDQPMDADHPALEARRRRRTAREAAASGGAPAGVELAGRAGSPR